MMTVCARRCEGWVSMMMTMMMKDGDDGWMVMNDDDQD